MRGQLIILALLLPLVSSCHSIRKEQCTWKEAPVSSGVATIAPLSVDALSSTLTLGEIVDAIGPAERDVGSGVYVLEWPLTNGNVFQASATSPCEVPTARRILAPPSVRQGSLHGQRQ
jgi:hypothetical protein